MRSPKDIRDTEFEKASRGYNIQDVDAFLAILADELDELLAEKAEMQTKMMMLAEKVDEYRKDEDILRSALVSAERMKDSLLQEAQQQKDIVLRDAQQKADKMVEEAERSIEREEVTLKALRQQVSSFKSEILSIYKSHLEVLSDLPETPVEDDYDDEAVAKLFTEGETPEAVAQTPIAPAAAVAPVASPMEVPAEAAIPAGSAVPFGAPAVPNPGEAAAQYDGFAPRDWGEPVAKPAYQPVSEPEFATFGTAAGEQNNAQPEKTESRFEKLDFGEDFTFGRD